MRPTIAGTAFAPSGREMWTESPEEDDGTRGSSNSGRSRNNDERHFVDSRPEQIQYRSEEDHCDQINPLMGKFLSKKIDRRQKETQQSQFMMGFQNLVSFRKC